MAYADVSSSHAEATAVPQGTQAATYFIFGANANVSATSEQSLTATPTSTAVAATGGSAGASGTGPGAAALPQYLPAAGGISTETILLLAAGVVVAFLIGRNL